MTENPEQEAPPSPLREPPTLPARRGSDLITGISLMPEQRLKAFAPAELELVVLHWLHEISRGTYKRIVEFAGPGDKGRDVVGYESATAEDPWDNYQCKQYEKKLAPGDIWLELGKLVYWTSKGAFSVPRKYTFVAPRGCGPTVRDLLNNPEKLRKGLLAKWDSHCLSLCGRAEIEPALARFQFPTLAVASTSEIIQGLKGAAIYPVLFGGGLTKPRPADRPPPEEIAAYELPYIGRLVEAYDEHCEQGVTSAAKARSHERYGPHLTSSRRDFYCAESLHEFSKDVLVKPDDFEGLQQQVYDGIKYTVNRDFPSGYDRVLAVCEQAVSTQISDHPLRDALHPADRTGICHQLANDGRVAWKRS